LRRAIEMLDESDCVVGPATDGSYDLIGLTAAARTTALPALFRDIPYGTSDVLVQTLHVAENIGLTVALLDELPVVDLPEDLAAAEEILLADQLEADRVGTSRWRGRFTGRT
jgi:hypothetical protein